MTSGKEWDHKTLDYNLVLADTVRNYHVTRQSGKVVFAIDEEMEAQRSTIDSHIGGKGTAQSERDNIQDSQNSTPAGKEKGEGVDIDEVRPPFIFFRHQLTAAQKKVIHYPSIYKLHFSVDRSDPKNLAKAFEAFTEVLAGYPNLVLDFKVVTLDNDGTREGAEITCFIPSNKTFPSNSVAARRYLSFANDVSLAFTNAGIEASGKTIFDKSIDEYVSYRVGHNGAFRDGAMDYAHDLAGKHTFKGCLYISTVILEDLHKEGLLAEEYLYNPNIYDVRGRDMTPKGELGVPLEFVDFSGSPLSKIQASRSLPDHLEKMIKAGENKHKREFRASPHPGHFRERLLSEDAGRHKRHFSYGQIERRPLPNNKERSLR